MYRVLRSLLITLRLYTWNCTLLFRRKKWRFSTLITCNLSLLRQRTIMMIVGLGCNSSGTQNPVDWGRTKSIGSSVLCLRKKLRMHKGNWFVCATGGGIKFRCREVDSALAGIVCEADIKLYADSTKYTSARSDACMRSPRITIEFSRKQRFPSNVIWPAEKGESNIEFAHFCGPLCTSVTNIFQLMRQFDQVQINQISLPSRMLNSNR